MNRSVRWFDSIWYLQNFLRGFILLYPVYAIWMLADGLTPAELSLMFIIWSGSAMCFEVPSGVLSDRFSRPRLMAIAFVIKALGFSIWYLAPAFPGYAAGFVCWALSGAILSGACESFLFESLKGQGREASFESVYGRGEASQLTGGLLAVAVGAALAEECRDAVYLLSITIPLLTATLCLTSFYEPRTSRTPMAARTGFVTGLKQGIRVSLASRVVLLTIAVFALLNLVPEALDEYEAPLLKELPDLSLSSIGLLLAAFTIANIGGNLLAEWLPPSGLRLVPLLYAITGGLLIPSSIAAPWLVVVIVVAMCFLHGTATVILQGVLQRAIADAARSTVTSLANFAQSFLALPFYAAFGAYATSHGFAAAFTMTGIFTVIAALWLWMLCLAIPGTSARSKESAA
jgi:MFS family permease